MNITQIIFGPVTQVFGNVTQKSGPGKIIAIILLVLVVAASASSLVTLLVATTAALYAMFQTMLMVTLCLFGTAAVGGVACYAWETSKIKTVTWDWNTVMHPTLTMNATPPRSRRVKRELPPATVFAVCSRGDVEQTEQRQLVKKGRA